MFLSYFSFGRGGENESTIRKSASSYGKGPIFPEKRKKQIGKRPVNIPFKLSKWGERGEKAFLPRKKKKKKGKKPNQDGRRGMKGRTARISTFCPGKRGNRRNARYPSIETGDCGERGARIARCARAIPERARINAVYGRGRKKGTETPVQNVTREPVLEGLYGVGRRRGGGGRRAFSSPLKNFEGGGRQRRDAGGHGKERLHSSLKNGAR